MDNSINSPRQKLLRSELKQARKDAGLTQKALASVLEKPQSFVSKYELGERRIEAMELGIILAALHIDYDYFVRNLNSKL